jgi:hypothetical protein
MPDFSELEKDAKDHPTQVDEGIDKAKQEGDKESGGRDHGLIDKGAADAEKEIA